MDAMRNAGAKEFFTTEGEQWTEKNGELVAKPVIKLETTCPPEISGAVIAAMLEECPEPNPVYEVVADESRTSVTYLARMGILSTPMMPDGLCNYVKERLGLETVGLVCREGMEGHYLNRIGVCSGAGGSLLYECAKLGIEVLITSEIKHNVALDALEMGIVMIDAGHYGIEKIFIPYMKEYVEREMPELRIVSCDAGAPFIET
jgi:putative NIF3 family GTP cyclohydrolase 1 type 2